MSIPATCVLCSSALESHDHLFFECNFSSAIWSFFASKFILNPLSSLGCGLDPCQTCPSFSTSQPDTIITKLILQDSVSASWKECNSRIFSMVSFSIPAIRKSVDRSLRDHLLSFSLSLLAFYYPFCLVISVCLLFLSTLLINK